jgi:hypothetical protein
VQDYVSALEKLKPQLQRYVAALAAEEEKTAKLHEEIARLRASLAARPSAGDGGTSETIAELRRSNAELWEKLAASTSEKLSMSAPDGGDARTLVARLQAERDRAAARADVSWRGPAPHVCLIKIKSGANVLFCRLCPFTIHVHFWFRSPLLPHSR